MMTFSLYILDFHLYMGEESSCGTSSLACAVYLLNVCGRYAEAQVYIYLAAGAWVKLERLGLSGVWGYVGSHNYRLTLADIITD